jgi:hypothetical protein
MSIGNGDFRGEQHSLQCLFLDRLHHIAERRNSWTPQDGRLTRRLIDHALYSTYMDCLAVGMRPVAQAVIAEVKHR